MAFRLLIHSDHANGSTDFADSSSDGRTLTATGNVSHSTAQSKFGGSSIYFDGNGDYITTPNTDYSPPDLTFDCWARIPANNSNCGIFQIKSATNVSVFLYNNAIKARVSGSPDITGDGLSLNTWHHVALVISGTSIYLFLDGVLQGTKTDSGLDSGTISIGYYFSTAYEFYGYMDEIALRDEAIWTTSFTPPTEPYETETSEIKIYNNLSPVTQQLQPLGR